MGRRQILHLQTYLTIVFIGSYRTNGFPCYRKVSKKRFAPDEFLDNETNNIERVEDGFFNKAKVLVADTQNHNWKDSINAELAQYPSNEYDLIEHTFFNIL